MGTARDRADRRDRHAAEVEASQAELRKSITETERLVDESDRMLRRHRTECEDADRTSGDGEGADDGRAERNPTPRHKRQPVS